MKGYSRVSFQSDAAACFLGLALGDALGAPFEGTRPVDQAEVEVLLASDSWLRWTDDTHMALALAASLISNDGCVDAEHVGDSFYTAWHDEPWRGYGGGPPRVFALVKEGSTYMAAAQQLYSGMGSAGNGAAMRVAPVAIACFPDAARTKKQARLQALVTHAHPEGADAAVVLAAVQHLALSTPRDQGLDVRKLQVDKSDLQSQGMQVALARLLDVVSTSEGPAPTRFRTSTRAVESVPAAIAIAAQHQGDVASSAMAAIHRGGDTDTVAAMAASIVGAHLGMSAIPDSLLSRLEQHDRIQQVVRHLVHVASGSA